MSRQSQTHEQPGRTHFAAVGLVSVEIGLPDITRPGLAADARSRSEAVASSLDDIVAPDLIADHLAGATP